MTQLRRFINRALLTGSLRAAAHFTRILHGAPDNSSFVEDAERESGYKEARTGLHLPRTKKANNRKTPAKKPSKAKAKGAASVPVIPKPADEPSA